MTDDEKVKGDAKMKGDAKSRHTINDLPPLFGQDTLAEAIDVSVSKLERDRWLGKGPPYIKLGGLVRYRREAVITHLDQNTIFPKEEA